MINCCLNILLHSGLATLYGLIKSFSEREKTNKVEKKKRLLNWNNRFNEKVIAHTK